jgi:D-glucosaminate-6-phosphate ammonia-lyase
LFEFRKVEVFTNTRMHVPIKSSSEIGTPAAPTVFDRLGVPAVINAAGIYTDLGGSRLSPAIWSDLTQLNEYFVRIPALLDKTGSSIAALLGVQAARITPGASAAIALAVGACMTGDGGPRWEQLPDTTGLKSEVVMAHNPLRSYKYAVCVRSPGAKIVVAGDAGGTNEAQLRASINERTAAVFIPAHLEGYQNTLNLADTVTIAHASGVPVIVDAAYMNVPPDIMRSYTRAGADLVCFSAKYYAGPNAGGFVAGRSDLIRSVVGLDFTRFESGQYRSFGRPFKMGRYEIAATWLALEAWFATDHDARLQGYHHLAVELQRSIGAPPGISSQLLCFTLDEHLQPAPVNCVALDFADGAPMKAADLAAALSAGSPSIEAVVLDDKLLLVTELLEPKDLALIAARVCKAVDTPEGNS